MSEAKVQMTVAKRDNDELDILRDARATQPSDAHRITDYEMLKEYIADWANGTGHKFLVILGRPGILKSSSVRSALTSKAHTREHLWVNGNTGPLALYRDIFFNNNRPTVLDDVKLTRPIETLLLDMTDNYKRCTLRWSAARALKVTMDADPSIISDEDDEAEDDHESGSVTITLPTSFQTSSRVCWITNDTAKLSDAVALKDRSYVIEFDPPLIEVLEYAKEWLHPDVYAWAIQHARLIPHASVRDLGQAGVNLRTNKPWEKILREKYINPRSPLGAYLSVRDDARFQTNPERIERFTALCGKSEREYYRVVAEYRRIFPEKKLPRGASAKKRKPD